MDGHLEKALNRAEFAISFEDLEVLHRDGSDRVRLVGPVTGCVKSGEVATFIGPSSLTVPLMNGLRSIYPCAASSAYNAVHTGTFVGGTVTWNGQEPTDVDPRVVAYVDLEAADVMPEQLTSLEILLYTIQVRVTFLSTAEQSGMADQVLDMLGIAEVNNTRYCDLSPANKRILRVAREIIGCAGMLLLNNPTCQLSPSQSVVFLEAMSRLSTSHAYAVIMAVPQVPPGCLSLFSDIFVLSKDGKTIYQGPASSFSTWFTANSLDRKHFSGLSGSSLALLAEFSTSDMLSHGIFMLPSNQVDKYLVMNADSDSYRSARRKALEVRSGKSPLPALIGRDGLPSSDRADLRWISAMLEMEWKLIARDSLAIHRYVVAPLFLGMLLGLVFSRLPDETVAVGMQERLGLFTILLLCFTLDSVRRRTALEKRMLWLDVCAGRMTLLAHSLFVCSGELFVKMGLSSACMALSVYLTASFKQEVGALLSFLLLTVASAWAIGILPICFQIVVSGSERSIKASAHLSSSPLLLSWAAGFLLLLFLLVAGYPLAPVDLPFPLPLLRSLSPYAYALDCFVANQMGGGGGELGYPTINVFVHLVALALLVVFYLILSVALSRSDYILGVLLPRVGMRVASDVQANLRWCRQACGWQEHEPLPDEERGDGRGGRTSYV
uniref:ABC transporter domain-containing protein n=1 Tax=Guillardia theta TaxID=55529 RepID=A0A7S4KT84_GUITH